MNSAVERKMKTKLVATTAVIHIFSRRWDHSARRLSAAVALGPRDTGARRLYSRSIMRPARASMVTKKKRSLRTMGPMRRISVVLEGRTPFSLSSCSPLTNNWKATKYRMTVVTRKKRCMLIFTLPRMKSTPKTTDTATPRRVPVKLRSSVELRVTAERMRTVSTPSRRTSRKTKKKRPNFETPRSPPVYFATFSSMEPRMVRAVLCMNQIMLMTNAAAASITQPSNMSGLNCSRASTTDRHARCQRCTQRPEDGLLQLHPPDLGQVGEHDSDDQRCFDTFAERDDKCLQHKVFLFPEGGRSTVCPSLDPPSQRGLKSLLYHHLVY